MRPGKATVFERRCWFVRCALLAAQLTLASAPVGPQDVACQRVLLVARDALVVAANEAVAIAGGAARRAGEAAVARRATGGALGACALIGFV